MKDRFEFRGYNKNLKKWFYGAYITQAEYADSPFEQTGTKPAPVNHFIAFEEMIDWGLPTKLKLTLVDKKSVGQCTGLKDRNGKLIYEGDILKVVGKQTEEIIGCVQWLDDFCKFSLNIANSKEGKYQSCETFCDFDYLPETERKIIGNIYENKELLFCHQRRSTKGVR